MNTIEAIRFINDHIRGSYYMGTVERRKADDINRLLRRGQKFEQMWEGFEKEYRLLWVQIKIEYNQYITLGRLMDGFKEKYFPKKKVIK